MVTLHTRHALALVVALLSAESVGSAAQRAAVFHLEETTIGQIQQAIRSHQITTVALVEQYLQRRAMRRPNGLKGCALACCANI